MGIFNGLFGSKESQEPKPEIPWQHLRDISQLNKIAKDSKAKPVAIYKHSTTCGISRMVLRQIESTYDIDASQMDIYYLDLKAYRDVSNEVAARFQVIHQSPQMIVIKNGTAVYADSHGAVNVPVLHQYL
ncbi:bacillithiol system redox-active protein YtxJ [uncultured Dokdonia sp.]|uniref:bacillithiol system redox-active protein YtxJ n=1 Tax=uncultured Dokdonia sp. TaxID=575653 RepID=UPI00261C4AC5|nr:bacillithiol system redox-active protein YtxJ [uncultured Dokdonia sp.]